MKIFSSRIILIIVMAIAVTVMPVTVSADLEVVREVTITPKSGRGGANIGPVNTSVNVSMIKADVTITVGALPASIDDLLDISVNAKFIMKNEASETLALTVGFPVSNSKYSAFELQKFTVTSNGVPRSVFNRVTGYPSRLEHTYVSGPDPEGYLGLPDYSITDPLLTHTSPEMTKGRSLFGKELIGKEVFQNLLVWKEMFNAGQVSTIEVGYLISLPLQKNSTKKEEVKGSYKNIWPQEANNIPEQFLNSLPKDEAFYFFDYYLTSGASWKGPIGEQNVALILDRSWNGHTLYRHVGHEVNQFERQGEGKTYVFSLRNTEPTANLLYALKRP